MKFVLEIEIDGEEYGKDTDIQLGKDLSAIKARLRRGYDSGVITGTGAKKIGYWKIVPGKVEVPDE
jgi:hypothetical protein